MEEHGGGGKEKPGEVAGLLLAWRGADQDDRVQQTRVSSSTGWRIGQLIFVQNVMFHVTWIIRSCETPMYGLCTYTPTIFILHFRYPGSSRHRDLGAQNNWLPIITCSVSLDSIKAVRDKNIMPSLDYLRH